jgi:hypothetical protein
MTTNTTPSLPPVTDFERDFLTSHLFDRTRYIRDWLVRQVLVRGHLGALGGPKKCLKTSVAVDLAVSKG